MTRTPSSLFSPTVLVGDDRLTTLKSEKVEPLNRGEGGKEDRSIKVLLGKPIIKQSILIHVRGRTFSST